MNENTTESAADVLEGSAEGAAEDNTAAEGTDNAEAAAPKKDRRKLLKILIPVAAALILLIVGVFLYVDLYYLEADVSTAYDLTVLTERIHLSTREKAELSPDLKVIDEKMVKRADRKMREGNFSYEVGDPAILSVSEEGTVTPKKVGTTEITVRFAELSRTVEVEVFIPIDNISLSEHSFSLHVGNTAKVSAVIEPANATLYGETVFSISNEKIASIAQDGTITAVSPGTVLIRMESNGFTDMASVYVDAPLKGISLNADELALIKGDTYQFEVAYDPENTTDSREVTYSLSDEEVGSVDANGLFTALAGGETVLTAKVGRFTYDCHIDVRVPLEGIRFTSEALTMRAGDSVVLPVSYIPTDTTDDLTTEWKSEDPGIVSVNQEGKVVAVGAGTTRVTATCGEFSTSMTITVIIPITGVTISTGSMTLDKGTSSQLAASVLPVNTTEERYIHWASDNANVATVDGNGVVTAVGPGTATIRAYHDDFSAGCVVTVLSHIEKIEFEQSEISLIETFSAPLALIFTPLDTTDDRTAQFWSADTDVAVIEGNTVRAVYEGTTTITASVNGYTATAEVIVHPFIDVEEIDLNTDSLTFSEIGTSQQIVVTVYPADATASAVSYSSTNTNVATVSSNGTVTATGSGDCVIVINAGGQQAEVPVHVNAANVVIVLDPGHGSTHGGAEWAGIAEQNINLRVAKVAQEYLMSHYGGVTVYLTHDDLPCFGGSLKDCLYNRCVFAQQRGAAFLVSIHFNISSNHSASGPIAYISAPGKATHDASRNLALSIIPQIEAATGLRRFDNGYSWSNSSSYFDDFGNPMDYYAINRHCNNLGFPGVIIEHCFMDRDTGFITSDDWLVKFGVADAVGIANYLGLPAK